MKLIAQGGTDTKYSPAGSKEAFCLGIKTDFVYGVCLNLYLTKDLKLIATTDSLFSDITKDTDFFQMHTLEEIQKFPFGSVVRQHQIPSLDEAMKLFSDTEKPLILHMNDEGSRNSIFVDSLLELSEKYPMVNLYVKSPCEEILSYLKTTPIRAKIGIVITEETTDNLSDKYDFYSFAFPCTNKEIISHKLCDYCDIMFENMNCQKTFIDLVHLLGEDARKVFYITDRVGLLYATTVYNLEETV